MGNCKDCKHCQEGMVSVCTLISSSDDEPTGDAALTDSVLYVGPDFGCVLFEAT